MKKLKKYRLNSEITLKYIIYNLEGGNVLSHEILKSIESNEGHFFTLLPHDANIERLYEFEAGVILPQNPEIKCFTNGREESYSITPSIKNELEHIIYNELKNNPKYSCLFEDLLNSPKSSHSEFFKLNNLIFFYHQEVYYLVTHENLKKNNISKCLHNSNALWHSLCVVSKANYKSLKDQKITLNQIHEISTHAELVIVGAYDGEGYIFWEKKGSDFFSN